MAGSSPAMTEESSERDAHQFGDRLRLTHRTNGGTSLGMTDFMAAPPKANVGEYTVSEISNALKKTVEDAYGYVRVRGEISGFKGASPSGHVYFRLKDDKAVLEGVIWKGVWG